MSIVRTVVRAAERVAPLRFAEKWDNVGLLLESPFVRQKAKGILLTIDLTPAVLEEALTTPTTVIISYHPPIFRPVSSFTLSDPMQTCLLSCASAGISVFSPHTALDNIHGGINDWLAEGLLRLGRATLRAIEARDVEGHRGAGRMLTYDDTVPLENLISSVKAHLGLRYVQLATVPTTSRIIKSVAICAGSGGSLLRGLKADVFLTGEMSHHDVLAAVAGGVNVVLCGHDNTERGYLPCLREKLQHSLSTEEGSFEVVISAQDRHPLDIV